MDSITFLNCSKRNVKRNIKFLENYTVSVINEQIENRHFNSKCNKYR